ncbi:MAG: TonB-dependent receptor [Bacteroidales bacterium]|nr:TonB-dependent receptor [Bacteroidales bacterium]
MKRMIISILIMIGLAGVQSLAQERLTQTIRGTVYEKATMMPLPGANVVLTGSDPVVGTSTDIDGKFRLDGVPVGRAGIRVTYIGFNDVVMTSLNLSSAKELILTIEMEEMAVMGKEVVITATRDKTLSENEMAIVSSRSFTVEESQRYAGSRNDVARMASNYAGVYGTDDARNDIIIRGNSPSGLLWRLEDVDIPNPNHYGAMESTGGPVSILNNNQLANSDFFTGAFPAEYGNAISGVFDLNMRNGNDEKHEFLGQIGFNGFELGAEGPVSINDGSSYLVNYRYSTLEVFEKLGVEFGTGTAVPKYQDISFKVNLPRTKAGSFSVFGLAGKSDVSFLDSEKDTTREKLNFYGGEGYDLVNGSDLAVIGLNHTFFINPTTYSRFTLAATYHNFATDIDSISPETREILPYFRNNHTEQKLFASYKINKKINSRHLLKAGIQASSRFFDISDSVYNDKTLRFDRITEYDGSAFMLQPYAAWQYKITNDLTLNSGLHYQHFFLNNTGSLEPRLGVRWTFAERQSLSFGYGHHSQILPITIYFNQVRLPDGSYFKPNKELKMAGSRHFIAGYDINFNQNMRLKAEAYCQYITNAGVDGNEQNSYSLLNQGANFYVWTPDTLSNKGTGRNSGIELTLERFLSKGMYYLFTASLYESEYQGSDEITRNTAFNGNYVLNGLFGKEWALGRDPEKKKLRQYVLQVDVKAMYAGGQRYTPVRVEWDPAGNEYVANYDDEVTYSEKYKDYFRTDFRIALRQSSKKVSMEWAIDVQNLFNNQNIYNQKFNSKTGEVDYNYQLGMLVIPQFRIEF